MKPTFVFLVLLAVAVVATAQFSGAEDVLRAESERLPVERSYINSVEYVDADQVIPHPSLVPHHFIEAEQSRRRRHPARRGGRQARRGGRRARAIRKKAGK